MCNDTIAKRKNKTNLSVYNFYEFDCYELFHQIKTSFSYHPQFRRQNIHIFHSSIEG